MNTNKENIIQNLELLAAELDSNLQREEMFLKDYEHRVAVTLAIRDKIKAELKAIDYAINLLIIVNPEDFK